MNIASSIVASIKIVIELNFIQLIYFCSKTFLRLGYQKFPFKTQYLISRITSIQYSKCNYLSSEKIFFRIMSQKDK
jgi:hypothetical protein